MSVKTEWTWNSDYQKLFDKAKSIMKEGACMKFYDETKPLNLNTDVSGVGLRAGLLQTRNGISCPRDMAPDSNILRPIALANKSIQCREEYSNIEREVLGILFCLEKVHHYCFTREVSIITDHRPLVAIFKKDVATLLQRLQ